MTDDPHRKLQKETKTNEAKKQFRKRRTYLRTADSLGRDACGITHSSPESLDERARCFIRSAQAYRQAGMSAAARVQWYNALVACEALENQTRAAYCRDQKTRIKLYDCEKEE